MMNTFSSSEQHPATTTPITDYVAANDNNHMTTITTSFGAQQQLHPTINNTNTGASPLTIPSQQQQQQQQQPSQQQHFQTQPPQQTTISSASAPPSFCLWYFRDCVWPGLGLFGESYLLFSIGLLQPIWELLLPDCFVVGNDHDNAVCPPALLSALHYSVVLGVMAGMLVIGYLAQLTGRRLGALTTAGLMTWGAAGLTLTALLLVSSSSASSDGNDNTIQNQATVVRAMVLFWALFGTGVGGEYPLAAAQASEQGNGATIHNGDEEPNSPQSQPFTTTTTTMTSHNTARDGLLVEGQDNHDEPPDVTGNSSFASRGAVECSHRGRQVQLVFSMQGLGILVNAATMTVLLMIMMIMAQDDDDDNSQEEENDNDDGQGNDYDYDYTNISDATARGLLAIWRSTYLFGTLVLLGVWYTRYLYLKESPVWQQYQTEREGLAVTNPNQNNGGGNYNNPHGRGGAMHMDGDAPLVPTNSSRSSVKSNSNNNNWQATALVPPRNNSRNHNNNLATGNLNENIVTTFSKSGSQQFSDAEATGNSGSRSLSGFGAVVAQAGGSSGAAAIAASGSGGSGAGQPQQQQHLYPTEQEEQLQTQRMAHVLSSSAAATPAAGTANNNNKPPPQVVPSTTTAQQQPYALNIVPSHISMISTVSSLSAPSVLALNNEYCNDEYFYQFFPEARPSNLSGRWRLLWRHYSVRLIGVSLSWLLWDIAFYGNKLFQSTFLLALLGKKYNDGGDGTSNINNYGAGEDGDVIQVLLDLSLCATLNAAVAFCGYLVAALLVDRPRIGRRGLQTWGFLITGTLFVMCGFLLDQLEASSSSSWLVTCLYLGTSFFGQVGPNATTFLIPAEIFPTEIRTLCHGIAAASGKLGALLAAIAFHQAKSDLDMFLFSGYCSLIAGALTYYTIPESLGLPLQELDRKWNAMVQNKPYTGLANQARYLSLFERKQLSQQEQRRDNHQQQQQDVDHVDLY